MEKQDVDKLSGTVVYLRTNVGSKSECVLPFLYRGREIGAMRLMLKDDNPFENSGLYAYDGRAVEVTGVLSPGGTFVADDVRMIDPAVKTDGAVTETCI